MRKRNAPTTTSAEVLPSSNPSSLSPPKNNGTRTSTTLNSKSWTTPFGYFLAFVKDLPISIRFIELMQTGDNLDYFRKHHLPASHLQETLTREGWTPSVRVADNGPAQEYTHPDYQGTIGIIAPYSKDFCAGCNRLRVTARGNLRLCLFGSQGISLREYLSSDDQKSLLKQMRTQSSWKF